MFNTVQTQLETLYHFINHHLLKEANSWLWNYLAHYNSLPHRYEKHSRLEDWQQNLPTEGYIDKCVIGKILPNGTRTRRKKIIFRCLHYSGVRYQLTPKWLEKK